MKAKSELNNFILKQGHTIIIVRRARFYVDLYRKNRRERENKIKGNELISMVTLITKYLTL